MSHRQKNKHKSRHRIHANNGPKVPQIGRAATAPVKAAPAAAETPAQTTTPVPAATA